MKIDEIDRRILKTLQRKGRMTNAELAVNISLSASACYRRVQLLEKAGIIKDYVGLLDAKKIFCSTTVFVDITLTGQTDAILDAFEKAVALIPNVLECHLMAGVADYTLKVVAKDTEDFALIHRHSLSRLPYVAQMQSNFALRTVFKTTALPV